MIPRSNRSPQIVTLIAGVLSVSRCAHPQAALSVSEPARISERSAEEKGEGKAYKTDYWDYIRCTATDLAIRWDIKHISQTRVAINYEVKNKSRYDINLLDRLMVPSRNLTYRLIPDAVIVQYAEEPGVIDLIRGSVYPYGVKFRIPPDIETAASLIKSGEVVQGRATLDIPLQSWHPARQSGQLLAARFIRLKIGYFIGTVTKSMKREMDDGTMIEVPVFSQEQYFACSAILPWQFPQTVRAD